MRGKSQSNPNGRDKQHETRDNARERVCVCVSKQLRNDRMFGADSRLGAGRLLIGALGRQMGACVSIRATSVPHCCLTSNTRLRLRCWSSSNAYSHSSCRLNLPTFIPFFHEAMTILISFIGVVGSWANPGPGCRDRQYVFSHSSRLLQGR